MTAANNKQPIDLRDVESFLYRETDLLDKGDLYSWRDLFTADGTYWMPVTPDQQDPLNHISIIYEDRLMMEIRAENFGHRLAASMQYDIRCSHIISNVRVIDNIGMGSGDDSLLTVKSNFQAVVFYRGQTLFAGTYTHQLKRVADDYRIVQKRVDLINCDADHRSIIIYI